MATFAVTGASGFIGHTLTEALLAKGYGVRALVRNTAPALSDLMTLVPGSLEDRTSLEALIEGVDGVIHLAGLTAARNRQAYFKANAAGTAQLLAALEGTNATIPLVHVSSLAAREPHLSDYSASKRAGETLVQSANIPWTIIRPPAVYGPNDPALRPLWAFIKKGVVPRVGVSGGRFSLIHVADLTQAIICLSEHLIGANEDSIQSNARVFEIDDQFIGRLGRGYGWDDIADIAGMVYGQRPKIIGIPSQALSSLAAIAQGIGTLRRAPSVFNLGKARELSHANWVTDTSPNWIDVGWSPCRQLRDTLAYL